MRKYGASPSTFVERQQPESNLHGPVPPTGRKGVLRMKQSITMTLTMTARLSGLLALGSGVVGWAGYAVPLYIHIALGSLLIVAVWSLAFQARSVAAGLARFAGAVGVFIPVVGLLQLRSQLGECQWVPQGLHLAAGLGGIAFAEILAKRIRLWMQTL